jgi:hypothetical protein
VNTPYGKVPRVGPVHRSIAAVDVERSTARADLAKGEIRRVMYDLLEQSLKAAGIGRRHREPLIDRGDGVLILIRPHADMPKTALSARLIPALAALLAEHNAITAEPRLRMRLRVVVHAGEVYEDGHGFYSDDIDVAFRLLNSPAVKRALRQAPAAPLVLVTSEEMWAVIVRHAPVDDSLHQLVVQVRVGERRRHRWVHIPVPARSDLSARKLVVVGAPQARPAASVAPEARPALSEAPGEPTVSAVYQALELHLDEAEEPYDVEAGLARLKEWVSTRQSPRGPR